MPDKPEDAGARLSVSDVVNFAREVGDDCKRGLGGAGDIGSGGGKLRLDEVFEDEDRAAHNGVFPWSVSTFWESRILVSLTMAGFDHGDEGREALLSAFRDQTSASANGTNGFGDDCIVCVVCVVL